MQSDCHAQWHEKVCEPPGINRFSAVIWKQNPEQNYGYGLAALPLPHFDWCVYLKVLLK